jgi:hypothetical protein
MSTVDASNSGTVQYIVAMSSVIFKSQLIGHQWVPRKTVSGIVSLVQLLFNCSATPTGNETTMVMMSPARPESGETLVIVGVYGTLKAAK